MEKQSSGALPLSVGLACGIGAVAFLAMMLAGGAGFSAALFLAAFVAIAVAVVLYIGFNGGQGRGGTIPAEAARRAGKAPSAQDRYDAAHRAGQAPTASDRADHVRRAGQQPIPPATPADAVRRAGTAPTEGSTPDYRSHYAGAHAGHSPAAGSAPTPSGTTGAYGTSEGPSGSSSSSGSSSADLRPVPDRAPPPADAARDPLLPGGSGAEPAAQPMMSPAATGPAPVAAPMTDLPGDGSGLDDEGTRPASLDAPRDGQPDDLMRIKGIGPRMQEMLHGLGFYHFDQIAGWNPQEVAWVDGHLEGFNGRVSRDGWVDQARILRDGGETEFSGRPDRHDAD